MDKAKAAVGGFLDKHGKKDTTVHESVNPAITKETVVPVQKEEVTTAVDKEVHQDHYHTSIQPVKDREVLPEQHSHNMAAVEKREYRHGDDRDIERKVAQEQAAFKDERRIADTQYSQSVAPTVGGEHVHHHVHETIQPVVQKETIQPSVVHTTVPIHEVHQNAAQHHGASTLPTMTMEELKAKGGTLTGREQRTDHFEGEPRGLTGGTMGSTTGGSTSTRDTTSGLSSGTHGSSGLTNPSGRDTTSGLSTGETGSSGLTNPSGRDTGAGLSGGTGTSSTLDPRADGQGSHLSSATGSSGYGQRSGTDGKFSQYDDQNTTGSTSSGGKPSLMDKINPKVDSTGDGKAGFMK